MRCFFISGETSGDKIGAALARVFIRDYQAEIQAWGGSYFEKEGVEVVHHISSISVMGITDVFKKLPIFLRLFSLAKKQIRVFNPDILILVDYGGFNLRMAKWANENNIKVVYYSPPKIWASRRGRLRQLQSYCNLVIVLFPFEKEMYKQLGLEVSYYGHPLAHGESEVNKVLSTKVLALLPGSRIQEVRRLLPVMLEAATQTDKFEIRISCAPNIDPSWIKSLVPDDLLSRTTIIKDGIQKVLLGAYITIVASGTATIEAALWGIPQIVCFKTSLITYWIAKRLIKVNYISLVNLMLDKEVVRELIQDECSSKNIITEVNRLSILENRNAVFKEYRKIKSQLFCKNAVENTAKAIIAKFN